VLSFSIGAMLRASSLDEADASGAEAFLGMGEDDAFGGLNADPHPWSPSPSPPPTGMTAMHFMETQQRTDDSFAPWQSSIATTLPFAAPPHEPTSSVVVASGHGPPLPTSVRQPGTLGGVFAPVPATAVPLPSGDLMVHRASSSPSSFASSHEPSREAPQPWLRYRCRFPGCDHHYASTDGVRKHCRKKHTEWLRNLGAGVSLFSYAEWPNGVALPLTAAASAPTLGESRDSLAEEQEDEAGKYFGMSSSEVGHVLDSELDPDEAEREPPEEPDEEDEEAKRKTSRRRLSSASGSATAPRARRR